MKKPKRNYRLVVPGAALILIYLMPVALWAAQPEGLYPTVAYGIYRKERLPVFDAEKATPISQYEGKKVKLPTRSVTIERSDYYNPGYIEVLDSVFEGTEKRLTHISTPGVGTLSVWQMSAQTMIEQEGARPDSKGYYKIRIKSREKLDSAYMALVCVPRTTMEKDILSNSALTVAFMELGSLEAGVEVEAELVVGYVPVYRDDETLDEYVFLPLFYSKGYEIQSSRSEEIYDYFRKKEKAYHEKLLGEYIRNNIGRTLKHTPIIRFLPYIPPEVFEKQGRIDTMAILTMDSTGLVEKVSFADELDPACMAFLERGLKDWMFLPPLSSGSPRPFRLKVPLKY